ncbi:MAG: radical SAM protein, partial [Deltaproteobacteria bacterium]
MRNGVVLVNPPPSTDTSFFPLGFVFLASSLEAAGIPYRILNYSPQRYASDALVEIGLRAMMLDEPIEKRLAVASDLTSGQGNIVSEIADEILSGDEALVGFSVFRTNVDVACLVAREISRRDPGRIVVLGGPETFMQASVYGRLEGVGAVVQGEGELSLVELCKGVAKHNKLLGLDADIAGVYISGSERAPSMPIATTGFIPLNYGILLPFIREAANKQIPLLFSKGCIFNCRFCHNSDWPGGFRTADVAMFTDQLEKLLLHIEADGNPKVEELTFALRDCSFNGSWKDCERLCMALKKMERQIRLEAQLVAGAQLDRDKIQILTEAGLRAASLGLESGSDRVRKAMNKPSSVSEFLACLERLVEAGLNDIEISVIVGWPDETESEYLETANFLAQLSEMPVHVTLNLLTFFRPPSPVGAGIRKLVKTKGGSGARWIADG